jgi:uncharacterized protein DUF6378
MSAENLLLQAAEIVKERRAAYGQSKTIMASVARRWSETLGQTVTPEVVVLCLIDLKLTRLAHDPQHRDSILDVAGYAAVLDEVVR